MLSGSLTSSREQAQAADPGSPPAGNSAWLVTHVLPHEKAIRRRLRRLGISPHEIDDLIQEAYCRLLAMPASACIEQPVAYFHQITKNLHLNRIARERRVPFYSFETLECPDNIAETADWTTEQELLGHLLLEKLLDALPDRCSRIYRMRRIEGFSQRCIAQRLGVSEAVVENDAIKGQRLMKTMVQEVSRHMHHQRSPERGCAGTGKTAPAPATSALSQ